MDFADAYLLTKLGHPELAGWWGKLLGGGSDGDDSGEHVGVWSVGVWSHYNDGQTEGYVYRRSGRNERALYMATKGTHEIDTDGSISGFYPVKKPAGATGIKISQSGSYDLYASVTTLSYNSTTRKWDRIKGYGFSSIKSDYICRFDEGGTHLFLNCKYGSSGQTDLTQAHMDSMSIEWIYD